LAKNLKINIKNTQIAAALNLSKVKEKLAAKQPQKKSSSKKKEETSASAKATARILPAEENFEKPKTRLLPSIAEEAEKEKEAEKKNKALQKAEEKKKKALTKEEPRPPEKVEEIIPPKPPVEEKKEEVSALPIPETTPAKEEVAEGPKKPAAPLKAAPTPVKEIAVLVAEEEESAAKKKGILKEVKPFKKVEVKRSFDSRDRLGLRAPEDEERWRKARHHKVKKYIQEIPIIRPTSLKVKLPISLKDLAAEMKLKSSELIAKLFSQGVVVTLNDLLEDETTVQLLGQEFGCEIMIDASEEERLRITDKSIKEEIGESEETALIFRAPVVTFMGHVDHGKTSLIDTIRKSNVAASEAGAITQHIGAFSVQTPMGNITILDTPGHEAFSAMRSRGAHVTDIIVLVIAGDEGIKDQTLEAINQAKEASVPILVAINKCDKPSFDAEKVYRQLSDHELLPEAWGGSTITVNCSALTGKGIPELLEMLALQAEILELKANPTARARGTVLESEMHKGLGAVATVLVQNGTLHVGDALVFGYQWGRIKNLHNQFGKTVPDAGPSSVVKITGLSSLAEAGSEFIVVKNEKEARLLATAREEGFKKRLLQQSKKGLEGFGKAEKKVLTLILRADVQGSLEALRASLLKIHSEKIDLNIINAEVGEISESDITLAAASKSTIIGFHTAIEAHAEGLIKQMKVTIKLHDIIFHAIDDVKLIMKSLLDKIPLENERGKALVKMVFKSSQFGNIAGCQVLEGTIQRNYSARVVRNGEIVWKGKIASLKRGKDDVRGSTRIWNAVFFWTIFIPLKKRTSSKPMRSLTSNRIFDPHEKKSIRTTQPPSTRSDLRSDLQRGQEPPYFSVNQRLSR
jgi:translation initiation factor IF-2